MKGQLAAAVLMLITAVIFAVLSFHSVPRNNTYLILAIVFAVLAAIRFRRAKTP